MVINGVMDLQKWIASKTKDYDLTHGELNQLADHINSYDWCPRWGHDWSDFLEWVGDPIVLL